MYKYSNLQIEPCDPSRMGIYLTFFLLALPLFLLLLKKRRASKKLPPGSLGLPIIGQSLELLRAMRANTAEKWVVERANKYGPISKLSLFGKPTVFIYGQAANKFVFTSDSSMLTNQQTHSVRQILGDHNLLELCGSDHKCIRDALVSFLKPDSLKLYVCKMEEEVRMHLQIHWKGKGVVKVHNLDLKDQCYKMFFLASSLIHTSANALVTGVAFNEDTHIQHNLFTCFWS